MPSSGGVGAVGTFTRVSYISPGGREIMGSNPNDDLKFDALAQEIKDLVRINSTANVIESSMRFRALIELSARLDTPSLMSLACLSENHLNSIQSLIESVSPKAAGAKR